MNDSLAWGILGTGSIARTFASQLPKSKTGRLVAVGSRSRESAERFGGEFDIPHRHASYDALLADQTVRAVYIATPHPHHAEWAIRAAQAKKHILCEKPLGLNYAEAMAVVEAAHDNDVFLMEAFMYRCAPQTRVLVELLRDRTIGDVRIIHATFSFHWPIPFNTESRLTNHALCGGGILDVGCYPMSIARLIAGVATGNDFAEPLDVKAVGHIGAQGRVDEWTIASLKFPGGIVAQLATGIQCNQESVVRIDGSEGTIFISDPFVPARDGGSTKITVTRRGESLPREIIVESPQPIYAAEADVVAEHLERRQAPAPAMSGEDSLGNMRALDVWRAQIGLTYDSEKPAAYTKPINLGRTLASSRQQMPYATIDGVDKKISRLVMGCDNQPNFPHAAVLFDDFFTRGGNAFDTAFLYGGGRQEHLLGEWMRLRGVRDQVVVIVKGGHTPFCTPTDVTTQLRISLERLKIDRADIYLLHRDNPDVPAGEFVDALNEHHRAGRIGAFGGSNWSIARVIEANDYARKRVLTPFSLVSNQFSLARMVDPIWEGCVSASDAESRAWFAREHMPLLAWSSQARGFFLPGRTAPEKREDEELVRCWYSDDNFERLRRVNEMAVRRNVLPINVALAYVLHQPFPTFALIGPRQLSETRTSFAALDVELTPDDLGWLNLER
jgi:predicted dehydrogenase/aryl-alcohol dehydrogenase-like predicted oxidoreductase